MFTIGVKTFLHWGMVGVKHFWSTFFTKFFANFIIVSPQIEIFMGVIPHHKLFKIFMIGDQFKVNNGRVLKANLFHRNVIIKFL